MPPLDDVLPLAAAKRYLNIPLSSTVNDDELEEEFIPPAVERVGRHLGRSLIDADEVTPSELLACKVVLGEYWRTQRFRRGGGAGGPSGAAIEADTGPAGAAPITNRLTELLGPPADREETKPTGSFPPATAWPDPAMPCAAWRPC